jgi:hypothetical protein
MEEEEQTPQELLASVVARAMEVKYEMCVDNNGMCDAPPVLLGELPTGEGFIAPDYNDGHPTDTLPMMLAGLAEAMMGNFESVRWKWLAYVVEGYAKPSENITKEELENHDRGKYEEEYKTNPTSDVREGLIVSLYPWEGTPIGTTVFYRYDDKGLPVYDEPEFMEGEINGNIADIFKAFTMACKALANAKNN